MTQKNPGTLPNLPLSPENFFTEEEIDAIWHKIYAIPTTGIDVATFARASIDDINNALIAGNVEHAEQLLSMMQFLIETMDSVPPWLRELQHTLISKVSRSYGNQLIVPQVSTITPGVKWSVTAALIPTIPADHSTM
jgi:hypothetical protein